MTYRKLIFIDYQDSEDNQSNVSDSAIGTLRGIMPADSTVSY